MLDFVGVRRRRCLSWISCDDLALGGHQLWTLTGWYENYPRKLLYPLHLVRGKLCGGVELVINMGNQYIICGASRSGKSILARRLQEKFKVSWILGDAIVSSMEDAFPDLGISHHGGLQDIGDRFADYVKFILWHYGYAGCGYVLDTTHLYPRHIIGMREKIGNVPAVFLGYTRADPGEKLRQIRSFDPRNWWTSELSDAELKQLIHNQISKSIELKKACGELGIPYVDVGQHFEVSLDRAEAILNTK